MEHSISFVTQELKLSAVLHLPNQDPLAVIIGCHGLMADKSSPKQIELARRCVAMGMAYFRFDHRGCGQSEGVFEVDTTLENRRTDLISAVLAAGKALGKDLPIGLFGSSLGGTVCLSATHRISPFAMVTLATPVQSRSIHLPENSPQSLKNEIFKKRLSFNITTTLESIHHILIIHGSEDETVPHENAHTIYRLAKHPKKLMIIAGGDHRISDVSNQRIFLESTVQWFSDCIGSEV